MNPHYDVVIVGSGFGGAVAACRLAQHGYSVAVLERGRRWTPETYPRSPGDAWLWDQNRPSRHNGWVDVRTFPRMVVAMAAGVGGGSLIYANVLLNAKEQLFSAGWPPELTYAELLPYYRTVGEMMSIAPVPEHQISERTKIMREAAQKSGYGDRFQLVDLGVSFDEQWNYDLPHRHSAEHSRQFVNQHGQQQGTCVHCGSCDIGCEFRAKNTLDLNYLAVAEQRGAEVFPLHLVRRLEQDPRGYRVRFDRIDEGRLVPGSVTGRIVVLAAGSIGTTEILLRARDEHRTLPALSPDLGVGWSSNGDFVTGGYYPDRDVSPSRGTVISSSIDFLDGPEGQRFYIEDGGVPDVLANWFAEVARSQRHWPTRDRALNRAFEDMARRNAPLRHVMPWFAQGIDAADGKFRLRRRWLGLLGKRRLHLDWDATKSRAMFQGIVDMHTKLSKATGGEPIVPPTWSAAGWLATPHPLGGCRMGTSRENGVVDHRGEVFGYPNLYVADAAAIPAPLGLNPAKTVAAISERLAGEIVDAHR